MFSDYLLYTVAAIKLGTWDIDAIFRGFPLCSGSGIYDVWFMFVQAVSSFCLITFPRYVSNVLVLTSEICLNQ